MYRTLTSLFKTFLSDKQIYKYGFNLSPMYRRTTARIIEVSDDLHFVKIKIPLNYKNKNYVGSIFGGSMQSATDPIYMIQLINILDDNYIIWDKAATIKYRRPAKETIYGEFIFSDDEIKALKKEVTEKKEIDIIKKLNLVNSEGKVFAEIQKTIYVADKLYYKEKRKSKLH